MFKDPQYLPFIYGYTYTNLDTQATFNLYHQPTSLLNDFNYRVSVANIFVETRKAILYFKLRGLFSNYTLHTMNRIISDSRMLLSILEIYANLAQQVNIVHHIIYTEVYCL